MFKEREREEREEKKRFEKEEKEREKEVKRKQKEDMRARTAQEREMKRVEREKDKERKSEERKRVMEEKRRFDSQTGFGFWVCLETVGFAVLSGQLDMKGKRVAEGGNCENEGSKARAPTPDGSGPSR